jgi:hypothetical protein
MAKHRRVGVPRSRSGLASNDITLHPLPPPQLSIQHTRSALGPRYAPLVATNADLRITYAVSHLSTQRPSPAPISPSQQRWRYICPEPVTVHEHYWPPSSSPGLLRPMASTSVAPESAALPSLQLSAKYSALHVDAARTNATLQASCAWGKWVDHTLFEISTADHPF